jgi:hypothetical protein
VRQEATFGVDLEGLEATLARLGIGNTDRQELLVAIEDEGSDGPKVRRWLQRLQRGGIALGTGVTAEMAATEIAKLLGLS